MKILLLVIFYLAFTAQLSAQVVISEVYANGDGGQRDQGLEWFEVYNIGSTSIDLSDAIVRRLDGIKKAEAWRIQLSGATSLLAPQHYAVIAQKKDLGIELCLDMTIILVSDPDFAFKNSGTQTLCFKTSSELEDCAPFNNSATFPDGQSRYNKSPTLFGNDDLRWWHIEDCEIMPNIFASPGAVGGFCHQDAMLLPHKISCLTSAGAEAEAETKTEKEVKKALPRKFTSPNKSLSCQSFSADSQNQFAFILLFSILLFILFRPKAIEDELLKSPLEKLPDAHRS